MISITLARDLTSKEIVHIRKVRRGLKCNCECIDCGEKLEAIQGPFRSWHFRHNVKKNCLGAQETAFHKAAKEIIKRGRKISIRTGKDFEYKEALIEEPLDVFRIDAIAIAPGERLLIEVLVTHAIESMKELYIEQNKLHAIEIDLRGVDRTIELSELERLVLSAPEVRRVIYPKEPTLLQVPAIQAKATVNSDDGWFIALITVILGYIGWRVLTDFGKWLKKPRKE